MFAFHLLLRFHIFIQLACCSQYSSLLKQLTMKNPYIISKIENLKTRDMFYLMKETMKINQTISLTTSISNKNLQVSPGIVIQHDQNHGFGFDEQNFMSNIQKPWIFVGEIEKKYSRIDKPVYVLINDTLWEHFENTLGTL